MLRNTSRAVTNKKQAPLMADHHQHHPYTCLRSPSNKTPTSPISSFLASPRFFNDLMSESPTSILDTKNNNSSSYSYPFGFNFDRTLSKPRQQDAQKATGLAMIDSIIVDEGNNKDGNFSKPVINRMALFGSKLKVQIPGDHNQNLNQQSSPPGDFGIKTRNCNNQTSSSSSSTPVVRELFSRQLSLKEMEMSEDYTCVITHGPNPKTTHIYDDCIVECCCDDDDEELKKKPADEEGNGSSDLFKCCHTCKDSLGHGKDVYIYRGDKAFCSHECRCQEIMDEVV